MAPEGPSEPVEPILALFFDRSSQEFDNAILATTLAHTLMQRGIDVRPQWANGAKLLVDDLQQGDVEEARVILHGRMARQYVFVKRNHLEIVLSAVQQITPWQQRPVLKNHGGQQLVPSDGNSSWFNCSNWRWHMLFPVRRTFIHYEICAEILSQTQRPRTI